MRRARLQNHHMRPSSSGGATHRTPFVSICMHTCTAQESCAAERADVPWPVAHPRPQCSVDTASLHHCSAWRSGVVDLCIVGPEATIGHQPTRFNVPSPRGRIRRRVPEKLRADTNTLSRVLRRCNTTPRRSGLIARHFLDAAGRLQAAAPQPVQCTSAGSPAAAATWLPGRAMI